MSILSLNTDNFKEIFLYLHLQDIPRVAIACQRFNAIIHSIAQDFESRTQLPLSRFILSSSNRKKFPHLLALTKFFCKFFAIPRFVNDPPSSFSPIQNLSLGSFISQAEATYQKNLHLLWETLEESLKLKNSHSSPCTITSFKAWCRENEEKLNELEGLNLKGKGLTQVPHELTKLKHLKGLFLGNNQLLEIPPYLSQLSELEILDLGSNYLTTIPPEVAKLKKLKILDIGKNDGLTSLPSEVFQPDRVVYVGRKFFSSQLHFENISTINVRLVE